MISATGTRTPVAVGRGGRLEAVDEDRAIEPSARRLVSPGRLIEQLGYARQA